MLVDLRISTSEPAVTGTATVSRSFAAFVSVEVVETVAENARLEPAPLPTRTTTSRVTDSPASSSAAVSSQTTAVPAALRAHPAGARTSAVPSGSGIVTRGSCGRPSPSFVMRAVSVSSSPMLVVPGSAVSRTARSTFRRTVTVVVARSLPAFVSVDVVDAVAEAAMVAGGASPTRTTIARVTDSPSSRSAGARSQTTAVPAAFRTQPAGARTNVVPVGTGMVIRGASGRPGPSFVTVAVSVRSWPARIVPGSAVSSVTRSTVSTTGTVVVARSLPAFVSVEVVATVAWTAMLGPGSAPTRTTIARVSDSPASRPEAGRSQTTAVPAAFRAHPAGALANVVPSGSGTVIRGSTGRATPSFCTTTFSVRSWPGRTGVGEPVTVTPRSTVRFTGTARVARSLPAFVSVEVVDAVADAAMLAPGVSPTRTTIARVTDSPVSRSAGARSHTTAVPAALSAQPAGAETNVVPSGIGIVTLGASGRPGPVFSTTAVSVRVRPGSAVPGSEVSVTPRSTVSITGMLAVARSLPASVSVDVVEAVAEIAMDGPGFGPTATTTARVTDSPASSSAAVRSQTTAVPAAFGTHPAGALTNVVPAGSGIVTRGSTGRAAPSLRTTAVRVSSWPGRTGLGEPVIVVARSTVWFTGTEIVSRSLAVLVSVDVVATVAEAEMLAPGASPTRTTIAFVTDSPVSRSDAVRSQTTAVPAVFRVQPAGAETNVVPVGIGTVTVGASGRPGPVFVTTAVSVRGWPGRAVPGVGLSVTPRSTVSMTGTLAVARSFAARTSVEVVETVADSAMLGPGFGPTRTTIARVSDSPASRPAAGRSQTTAVPAAFTAHPAGALTNVVPAGSGIVTRGSVGRATPSFWITAVIVRSCPGRTGLGEPVSATPRSTVWSTGIARVARSLAAFVSVDVVETVAEAARLPPGVSPTRTTMVRVSDSPLSRSAAGRSQTTEVPMSVHPAGALTRVVPAGTGIVTRGASGRPGPVLRTVADRLTSCPGRVAAGSEESVTPRSTVSMTGTLAVARSLPAFVSVEVVDVVAEIAMLGPGFGPTRTTIARVTASPASRSAAGRSQTIAVPAAFRAQPAGALTSVVPEGSGIVTRGWPGRATPSFRTTAVSVRSWPGRTGLGEPVMVTPRSTVWFTGTESVAVSLLARVSVEVVATVAEAGMLEAGASPTRKTIARVSDSFGSRSAGDRSQTTAVPAPLSAQPAGALTKVVPTGTGIETVGATGRPKPVFVTTAVRVRFWPGRAVPGSLLSVTPRSTVSVTGTTRAARSLLGSVSAEVVETVAETGMVGPGFGPTRTTTDFVSDSPASSSAAVRSQTTEVPAAFRAQPAPALTNVVPEGSGIVSFGSIGRAGPSLVTVAVSVRSSPGRTGPGSAAKDTPRSTDWTTGVCVVAVLLPRSRSVSVVATDADVVMDAPGVAVVVSGIRRGLAPVPPPASTVPRLQSTIWEPEAPLSVQRGSIVAASAVVPAGTSKRTTLLGAAEPPSFVTPTSQV
ncbi:unannotated protein [freshwater metagenome]|uniref:Unannotated protein n=1 Tax=freshwater metagenome TaxID=449393 RepID=A0A6J7J6T0_9ZZZZ